MNIQNILSENGLCRICTDSGIYAFSSVASDIVRAVYTKGDTIPEKSLIVKDEALADSCPMDFTENETAITMTNGAVTVIFQKSDGCCTWYRGGVRMFGERFKTLVETPVERYDTGGEPPVIKRIKTVDGERSFIENLKPRFDRMAWRGRLGFLWDEEEGIYGFGQGEEGIYNYRHHQQYLYQHNMRIPMPMLVSSKGYGLLFDCCSLMTFNEENDTPYLFFDTIDRMEYYVLAGESLDNVISGYRKLTGKASMLPRWAFGYVQSKEAYHNADELLQVGTEYRRRHIPLDCVVQDWNTWAPGLWGEKKLDRSRYGNLKAVIDRLHHLKIHTMVSVWPNMAEGGTNHREFVESGHILGDNSTYDAFSEEARTMYWRQASEELFSSGFDAWWCDSTEPFSGPDWNGSVKREPWERFLLVGNEHKKYLDAANANAFALMHAKGIYENQRKQDQHRRVLNLTRSGYASQQQYGTVLWSGDIYASWETLHKQIAEGLNLCMCGIPYWTLDIGAFFVVGSAWQKRGCNCNQNPNPLWFWQGQYNDGVADPAYCELYTRWFEYGTFLPMLRSHGTDTPREIWNFGEPGTPFYDAIEKFIRLRYRLLPYLYSMAGMVTQEDFTILRSLLFDFPRDKNVHNIGTEFMFGKSLLVCPVTQPMYFKAGGKPINPAKQWTCYLPAGTDWYDFWTEKRYAGGQSVIVDAPLDRIPLFVRAGSILPLAQDALEYADQKLEQPILLMVYPGANGSFSLYEDAGDGYAYENGEFCRTQLTWDDTAKQLHIGARQGHYAGMGDEPRFDIRVVGD